MPRLSTWMVRAALLYLGMGLTLGALMLFNKGIPLHPALWRLLPVHIEFLLLGWTAQLAMGVAFWALPRLSGGRGRGNVRAARLAFVLLNMGVLSVGLGLWVEGLASLVLWGRIAEGVAVLVFAYHSWPRIKALGT